MSDPTTPEQRPPLPDPNGGCVCTWHTQDAGAGYSEVIPEYEPACPEHSTHLYDPRAGMWINDPRGALDRVRELADELEASPKVGATGEEQWELDTRRVVGRELRDALDGEQ
ncbi:hypothetical protein MYP14_06145 [Rhodococcus pyridinivorans]|uniref:hypothetical protein n=1 Tax=Rhodococcus pyridinivorans TaxID=103816 RepID=UPI001FFFAB03|nr:hypothetical protein [Rhodococcus pyridinivorans]UPK64930.1 hypothetical protein MYP14_06145 [Rhodococcus pyridinivorans]